MASVKAKLLEGYYDDINQTKQEKKTTPAQWHKAGMTAPEEEMLAPADRVKQNTRLAESNVISTPKAPAPSTPSVSSTPPVILQGSTTPNQNNQQNNLLTPGYN